MPMRRWVWNTNIALKTNRGIPSISLPQDSHLFDHKPRRNGSMQVDWNYPNLGQLKMQICYWILFKLRKYQRFKLPILLESGKTKSPSLEVFPRNMQLLNGLLKNLRRNFTQLWEFLLGSWQVVKLLDFSRKLQVWRKDVLFFQGASINQTLPAITPIFYLPQCIVVCAATDIHPPNEHLFLSGIWIDLVAMSECQHSSIIVDLLEPLQPLIVKERGVEL